MDTIGVELAWLRCKIQKQLIFGLVNHLEFFDIRDSVVSRIINSSRKVQGLVNSLVEEGTGSTQCVNSEQIFYVVFGREPSW
jgi:hypothetical protein